MITQWLSEADGARERLAKKIDPKARWVHEVRLRILAYLLKRCEVPAGADAREWAETVTDLLPGKIESPTTSDATTRAANLDDVPASPNAAIRSRQSIRDKLKLIQSAIHPPPRRLFCSRQARDVSEMHVLQEEENRFIGLHLEELLDVSSSGDRLTENQIVAILRGEDDLEG
ncbi:MAG: hypothetical protein AAFY08_09520 [Planctomycetota bacterium]